MIDRLTQLYLICFLTTTCLIAHAGLEQSFGRAQAAFYAYTLEQGGSFESAWQEFEQLDLQYPDHPAVQMYYGSLETVKARDAWMPWSKMKWVEQGLDRMDRALSLLEPVHEQQKLGANTIAMDSRLVAANTFLAVPSFLNRLQDAKDVLADMLDSVELEQQPLELRQAIYRIGVKIAEKEGKADELAAWQQKLAQLNP